MPPEKEKAEAFLKEFGELREKHKMDFVSLPTFQPTERGTWELKILPQIVSTQEEPTPSPFISSE